MKNVMLDLETMGKSANAAICSIGAVEFDLEIGELGREFYTIVDLESSVNAGGVIDSSTVLWWLKQSDTARAELQRRGNKIELALVMFSEWLDGCGFEPREICIWGNGAAFDNVILRSAYENSGIKTPWEFWNDRCYRTVKNMHRGVEIVRTGTQHCAVDDARDQARHLVQLVLQIDDFSGVRDVLESEN